MKFITLAQKVKLPSNLESSHRRFLASAFQAWELGYSRTLGMHRNIAVQSYGTTDQIKNINGIVAEYTVSPEVCRKTVSSEAYLSCGILCGVVDEITSLSLMMGDRMFRPGVSVSLKVKMLQKISLNEKLLFKTKNIKIGKMLGFCDFDVFKEKCGTLVGNGNHIKFLPMGVAWDIIMKLRLESLLLKFYQKETLKRSNSIFWTKGIPEGESIKDQLPLINFSSNESIGKGQISVNSNLCNYLGTFHGGAICAYSEQAALASSSLLNDRESLVSSMETYFYSALKGKLEVQSEQNNSTRSQCLDVLFEKDKKLMARSKVEWQKF
mmetsp:Transcript_10054/g.15126  ORF Transcript_10054/g.15126 Transcript_10054/m.15126 type:complete len:324 (+) Transcript_10054:59-1030(+)